MPMKWPDFKKGDRVTGSLINDAKYKGMNGTCVEDNTCSPFGHKHVKVKWDGELEPQEVRIRTHELMALVD